MRPLASNSATEGAAGPEVAKRQAQYVPATPPPITATSTSSGRSESSRAEPANQPPVAPTASPAAARAPPASTCLRVYGMTGDYTRQAGIAPLGCAARAVTARTHREARAAVVNCTVSPPSPGLAPLELPRLRGHGGMS